MEYAIISLFITFAGWLISHGQQMGEYEQQNQLLDRQQRYNSEREDLAYQRSEL